MLCLDFPCRFYEAQQSGPIPSWNRAAKANGGWRSNSHMQDGFGPGGINSDLSGGLYDAGGLLPPVLKVVAMRGILDQAAAVLVAAADHLKLHLPLGMALTTLAWGALEFEVAYRAAGQWDVAAATLDRAARYLVKWVGDVDTDHNMWWGRPEQQPQGGASGSAGYRPVYVISSSSPGADITGQAAAAMAAISLVLAKPGAWQNNGLAADLQSRARQLLAFARAVPGSWRPPVGGNAYPSSNHVDEVALASLWVCKVDLAAAAAPGLPASCTSALTSWQASAAVNSYARNWDWDQAHGAAAAMLFSMRSSFTCSSCSSAVQQAQAYLQQLLGQWQDTSRRCPAADFTVCYTPGGLAWLTQWGSLRHTGNIALLAAVYARELGADVIASPAALAATRRAHRCWVRSQLGYMAGSNPAARSYVVGYQPSGVQASPQRPHHKSASCSPDYSGALVGGPGNDDGYADVRNDYIRNEVTLDYNAGFTGALAGLHDSSLRLAMAGCSWDQYCAGPVSTRATAACLACATLAAPSGNEWACSEYCTDPSLITSGSTRWARQLHAMPEPEQPLCRSGLSGVYPDGDPCLAVPAAMTISSLILKRNLSWKLSLRAVTVNWLASAGHDMVLIVAPGKLPQAPCSSQAATQAAASEPGPSIPPPAKHSKRTKAEQAAEPTQPKGKSKAQGKAAKAKPARQVAGQGLQCSAQHAVHWGEQVASTRAVLVARPDSSASQGQGVP
ncbi:hypothetical protein QJQ45_013168 [Haematococcus lacustris]|nr:hypothetical protein QJQ45_013168 [Haematococcus lacustris]